MGGALAKAAIVAAQQLNLDIVPARLLIGMCAYARDRDNGSKRAGRFFAGREGMAVILGRVPDDPISRADAEAVRAALAVLIKTGIVECVRPAVNGRRAEYDVTKVGRYAPVADVSAWHAEAVDNLPRIGYG